MKIVYSSDQLEKMREALAEHWINEMPEDSIKEILLNGCEGYNKVDVDTLTEEFQEVFGDEYFDND